MKRLTEFLNNNTYPGRGIVLGTSPDGTKQVIIYFIMGRSTNSRNRVFVDCGDSVRTKVYDEAKLADPSLIIYTPVRSLDGKLIVTNGDQTDTIYNTLLAGGTFMQALRKRAYEPDSPNFTPRISGIIDDNGYALSILKAQNSNMQGPCARFSYEYQHYQGTGRFIHTYMGDGNPLPTFEGEPRCVAIEETNAAELAKNTWNALGPENRVSLLCCYRDMGSDKCEFEIINANGGNANEV